jgi:hypothetical protein
MDSLISHLRDHPHVAQISFTAVCSLVAAIIGALIVHKLTRSRDHDIWVRDSQIKEWQELLNELTEAYMTLLGEKPFVLTEKEPGERLKESQKHFLEIEQAKHEALASVDVVLSTRIFISDAIEQLDLRRRWAACVTEFINEKNREKYRNNFRSIRISIVEAAKATK